MSRYRPRQQRDHSWLFTAKGLLRIIGVLGVCGALIFWWGVQSAMTSNWLVAGGLTLLLSLASPGLTSFIIPWSPAGMLLASRPASAPGEHRNLKRDTLVVGTMQVAPGLCAGRALKPVAPPPPRLLQSRRLQAARAAGSELMQSRE